MLTQLEKGPVIDGSRQGLIGLTDAAGNQRYAFYVNVGDTCVDYTPTATGNSVVSIFVRKCATDSVWYIDWEGRSQLLNIGTGGGGGGNGIYGGSGTVPVGTVATITETFTFAGTDTVGGKAPFNMTVTGNEPDFMKFSDGTDSLVFGYGDQEWRWDGSKKIAYYVPLYFGDSLIMADVSQGLTNDTLFLVLGPNGEVRKKKVVSEIQTILKYDNYRLPATKLSFSSVGLNANESVANYPYTSVDASTYKFSSTAYGTTSTDYGGWLANGTSGDSIAVSVPAWVIIGDSQAEGHPARHGRLHPYTGATTFEPYFQDTSGQLSYQLRQLTNMRWFNHGISSQTTTQVWARWRRDVLAEYYDPGDGRGGRTLWRKPMGVVVVAGVNDLYAGSPVSTVQDNMLNMAKSARDNAIQCVFLNCPGDEIGSLRFYQAVDSLNQWMGSGALQAFGAAVVDYNSWWRDTSYNDNAHGNAYIVDDIHPSEAGYDSLAVYIFESAQIPVLDSVSINTELSPLGFAGFSRPTDITILGSSYSYSGDNAVIPFSTPLDWDSTWVKIVSSTDITGTSYSGFSTIKWIVQNDTNNIVTKRPALFQNYNTSFSASGATNYMPYFSDANTINYAPKLYYNPSNNRLGFNTTSPSYDVHFKATQNMLTETASGYVFATPGQIEMYSTGGSSRFKWVLSGGTRCNMTLSSTLLTIQAQDATYNEFDYTFNNRNGNTVFFADADQRSFGIGTAAINTSAALQVDNTTKGFLPPRQTTAQRTAIASPAEGLNVHDTDEDHPYVYANATWNQIAYTSELVQDGVFNGDQLSWDGTDWISVHGNRSNSFFFSGTAAVNSQETTEFIADTTATTSTLSLNFTPSATDFPSTGFTITKYIYNFGSGTCTVNTTASWKFFILGSGYSSTLSIASGESYKLIWRYDSTPANARFYAVKIQ